MSIGWRSVTFHDDNLHLKLLKPLEPLAAQELQIGSANRRFTEIFGDAA
jgi:hypothetical protein